MRKFGGSAPVRGVARISRIARVLPRSSYCRQRSAVGDAANVALAVLLQRLQRSGYGAGVSRIYAGYIRGCRSQSISLICSNQQGILPDHADDTSTFLLRSLVLE